MEGGNRCRDRHLRILRINGGKHFDEEFINYANAYDGKMILFEMATAHDVADVAVKSQTA